MRKYETYPFSCSFINQLNNQVDLKVDTQGGVSCENVQVELFLSVLDKIKTMPNMIEIGSNDAFYSIMFNRFFDSMCKNTCIEVSKNMLLLGQDNANKNNCTNMEFIHAYVGDLNMPYFDMIGGCQPELWGDLSAAQLDFSTIDKSYNIIHMDVQGSEVTILDELKKNNIKWEYMFVSVHQNNMGDTYQACKDIISTYNVEYLFDNQTSGGCGDGLIVCRQIMETI